MADPPPSEEIGLRFREASERALSNVDGHLYCGLGEGADEPFA
jgi:hypothetical protein